MGREISEKNVGGKETQRQRQKHMHYKNERSAFSNGSKLESISFSQKDFKPITATRVKLKRNDNKTGIQRDSVLRLAIKIEITTANNF